MIDYESLDNTLKHFSKNGYPFEFQAEPCGLYCERLDRRLAPDEFDIIEVYHFGETGEPEQLLYLLASSTGMKGTLVLTSAQVYSENMTFGMAQKLRVHPYGEWICS